MTCLPMPSSRSSTNGCASWPISVEQLKEHKLKDVDFQAKLESLYKQVDLADLVRLVDLDRLAEKVKFPARGGEPGHRPEQG